MSQRSSRRITLLSLTRIREACAFTRTQSSARHSPSSDEPRSRSQRGFTLIDLMIALAVLALLLIIALPSYLSQVRRGNRAGAQQYLQDLANREEQYRLDARAYTTSKTSLGYSADPLNVGANYTVAITTSGNDCAATAVVAPAYVINATATGSQVADGNLCLDNLGQKTPSTKW